jgi:hypothetical protein
VHRQDRARLEKHLDCYYKRPSDDGTDKTSSTASGNDGRSSHSRDTGSRSQVVRHMSAWVPVKVLDRWDIWYSRA